MERSNLADGLSLIAIAVYLMPATGVLAAIATWAALRRGRVRWPLVGLGAVIVAVPYVCAALLAGTIGLIAIIAFALDDKWGLLNPLVAFGAASAVAERTRPRSS